MQILFIGDIFGKPGREIARRAIPALVEERRIDFVIANVENSAAGFGVTGDIADTILSYGVDAMTSGNHIWDKKEVLEYVPRQPKLLRPANFPAGVPGRGVLAVRDHDVNLTLFDQRGQDAPDDFASRLAEDVADEQDPHASGRPARECGARRRAALRCAAGARGGRRPRGWRRRAPRRRRP